MQKILSSLLLVLLCTLVNSCSKSNNNGQATTYSLNGLSDVMLAQGENDQFTVTINSVNSYQEEVSLAIEGLPAGVTASFSRRSGIPTFSSTITITNHSAATGTYHCKLIVTGSATGAKIYNFDLTISNQAACGLVGVYRYTSTCNTGLSGNDNVTAFTGNSSIRFTNFGAHGWNVYAYINCADGTLEVPVQSIGNGQQVSGNGNFSSGGYIAINYTIADVGGANAGNCRFTMVRTN